MTDIALMQLTRRKGRTSLTILGVAIGILLVTSLSSISEGIGSIVNSELSLLSGRITITSGGIDFQSFPLSELDESLIDDIGGMSGIEKVTGIIVGNAPNVGPIYAIHMTDLELFNLDVDAKEGRFPEEGEDEIALGYKYADSSTLKVGDQVGIRGKKYDVVGIITATGTEADTAVITSFEPAQEMLKMKDKVTVIIAKPYNADEAESLAGEIENQYPDVSALSAKDAAREAQKFTGQLSIMTFALGSISALIAGIGIMNVMFMSVRERRKEIGVMKALGATTNEILLQVIFEAVTITLIGEAIGLLLSLVAISALNTISTQISAIITPSLLLSVTLFAIGLGVFSGLLPAREAAKTQPAVVLRYE